MHKYRFDNPQKGVLSIILYMCSWHKIPNMASCRYKMVDYIVKRKNPFHSAEADPVCK